jgi:hypothetical protein
MGAQPADACPFSRPFADDFAECPTYEAIEFQPSTLANDPLTPAWTCSHLGTGTYLTGSQQHKYGVCVLGDAAARLEWLKQRIASKEKIVGDAEPALGLT